jgi:hypothetical protein
LGILVGFVSCDGEFEQTTTPAGGQISIDGGPAFTVIWNSVSFQSNATTNTVNIFLSGSYVDPAGALQISNVNLVLPLGVTFQELDLSLTTSNYIENLAGGGVTFSSTMVEGGAFVEEVSNNGVRGSFFATFEDANGNTRDIVQGNFVLNHFDLRP